MFIIHKKQLYCILTTQYIVLHARNNVLKTGDLTRIYFFIDY